MKLALQIISWIAVVLGALAIIDGLSVMSYDSEGAYYSMVGGAMFLTQGVVALIYVNQQKKF